MSDPGPDLERLRRDAAAGNAAARYNLGVYHLGVAEAYDPARARALFEQAADQGLVPAMSALGYVLWRGQGVPSDPAAAAAWFERAAEHDYAQAQYALGELAATGAAGEADLSQARHWLGKAAGAGHAQARHQLAYCLALGLGGEADGAGAVRLLGQAASQDHPGALFDVALRLRDTNPERALACLLRAGALGYRAAASAQRELAAGLDAAAQQRARALAAAPLPPTVAQGCDTRPPRVDSVPDVVSWQPRIVRFPDVVTEQECAHLIHLATPFLQPARVLQRGTGAAALAAGRRSGTISLTDPLRDVVVATLERRLARYAMLPVSHGEPLTVLRYAPGDEYRPHYDYFDPADSGRAAALARGGQRLVTFMMYLCAVDGGGATAFPEVGVEIPPEPGCGLLFFNVAPDGQLDPGTRHAGCPVTAGEKWIATRWMREAPFTLEPAGAR